MTNLFLSLYPEKNKERQVELLTCLQNNAKVFDQIFILTERDEEIKFIPEIKSKANIFRLPVTVRPTFRTFFQCINKVTGPDDCNVISNSDIYVEEITRMPQHNEVWALCRYEVDAKGNKTFLNRKDSTDTWLFRGNIRIPRFCDFHQGFGGCDNRINYELKEIGYHISNPSITIKSFHLHTGEKSYTPQSPKINRPYHFLPPIELI